MSRDESTLKARIRDGLIIERPEDANAEYVALLKEQLLVTADSEYLSAFALMRGLRQAPDPQAQMIGLAIIQDELTHAYSGYRLLADLGEDVRALLYRRQVVEFRNHYFFGCSLYTWAEFIACNILSDRAGYVVLKHAQRHGSYGPWRRALSKVIVEERFHVRHGEHWLRQMQADPDARAALQRAVDWIFPAAVEFYWVPDAAREDLRPVEYGLMAHPNELLQRWLAEVVPCCQAAGLMVPAHRDPVSGEYRLDYQPPVQFDPVTKRWLFDRPATADEVLTRRYVGGPDRRALISTMRRGFLELARLREGQAG